MQPLQETDFTPLVCDSTRAVSVAALIADADCPSGRYERTGTDDSDRIVGTIVHRLLQRFGVGPGRDDVSAGAALAMLDREPMNDVVTDRPIDELIGQALSAYRAIAGRSDIRALYETGEAMHELRFTAHLDTHIVRGTIDCLIRSGDERLTVLEFKTGHPRDADQMQVELYRRAVEQLFPGAVVDARLIYAAEAPR